MITVLENASRLFEPEEGNRVSGRQLAFFVSLVNRICEAVRRQLLKFPVTDQIRLLKLIINDPQPEMFVQQFCSMVTDENAMRDACASIMVSMIMGLQQRYAHEQCHFTKTFSVAYCCSVANASDTKTSPNVVASDYLKQYMSQVVEDSKRLIDPRDIIPSCIRDGFEHVQRSLVRDLIVVGAQFVADRVIPRLITVRT